VAKVSVAAHPGLIRRAAVLLLRIAGGSFRCLNPLGSLLMMGWVMRSARQRALAVMMQASNLSEAEKLERCRAVFPDFCPMRLPGFVIGEARGGGIRRLWRALAGNLRTGIAAAFSLYVLLLPGQALMLFAWWGGWENSFNKGYEQALVGPLVSFAGIGWFVAAAYYASFAIGRQSLAGWQAFFQWRLNWRLLRLRPWFGFGLALLTALAVLPFSFGRMGPFFFPKTIEGFEQMDAEALSALAVQYTWVVLAYVLLAGLLLKRLAAGFYAHALIAAYAANQMAAEELTGPERAVLQGLALENRAPEEKSRWWYRLLRGFSQRVQRLVLLVASLAAWFGVIAQLYIVQFANHDWLLWINHPMLELVGLAIPQP